MSYILDALKRSEQERHQEHVADLSSDMLILPARSKKVHLWPYLIIAALAFNVLAYVYFNISEPIEENSIKDGTQSDSIAPLKAEALVSKKVYPINHTAPSILLSNERRRIPAHVMQTPVLTKGVDIQKFDGLKNVNQTNPYLEDNQTSYTQGSQFNEKENFNDRFGEYHEEGILIRPKSYQKQQSSDLPIESEVIRPALMIPQGEPVDLPAVEMAIESVEAFEGVPHLSELSTSFQRGIPDLTFNSHIFSHSVASRRVMINSIYLKEGQGFLGMSLVEIGEYYILVAKDDQQFKLPVLRDWASP